MPSSSSPSWPCQELQPSYPPLFRRAMTSSSPSVAVPPTCFPTAEPPLVDLHLLDPAILREACMGWGIFRLANHDVPPALSASLHRVAKQLVSLPFESKQKQPPPVSYFWGSPAVTQEVANLNWMEGFHVSLPSLQAGDTSGDIGGPEDGLGSSFRNLLRAYGRHVARISRTLFEAMAADLQLDCNRSALYMSDSEGMIRVYRYPVCPDVAAGQHLGMESHTDSSVLSIVNQDGVNGLQFLRDETWFHVRPVANTLVVNLGDMMKAMSDDRYRSVEHRVLASRGRERISICYFAFPQEDSVIVSTKYRAFTYKEFAASVSKDIRAVGFKIGLDNFKAT